MHSSRMRTERRLTISGGGGGLVQGVCLVQRVAVYLVQRGGVSGLGVVCLVEEVCGQGGGWSDPHPLSPGTYPPPPNCGQNDRCL